MEVTIIDYLIDQSDNSFQNLAFERSENNALVLNGEGDEGSPISDQSFPYAFYSCYRHYKPMSPTVTQTQTQKKNAS